MNMRNSQTEKATDKNGNAKTLRARTTAQQRSNHGKWENREQWFRKRATNEWQFSSEIDLQPTEKKNQVDLWEKSSAFRNRSGRAFRQR